MTVCFNLVTLYKNFNPTLLCFFLQISQMFSTVRGENMSQHNRGASDTDSDVQLAGSIVSEPTRIPTPQSSSTVVEVNEVILSAFSWLLFA